MIQVRSKIKGYACAAMLTALAATSFATAQTYGGELHIALHRDPARLEPHISQGATSTSVQGNIYDTLIQYDETGAIVPALATSWTIEDELIYTFHLREGVSFHNGQSFTAADVIASFDRIANPETGATSLTTVTSMASYEAVDPYTVRIVLHTPNAVFLHELASSTSYILSEDDIASGFDFTNQANGTGPFTLESWEPNGRYVLARNPNYWIEGLPYLDRVVMNPIIDDRARVAALQSGEVHLAEYVPWQYTPMLESEFTVLRYSDAFNLLRLHHSEGPTANKLVRQALNYIVDRDEALLLAFGGEGTVITGPLQPQGSPYYYEDLEGYYTTDHERARELLAQAGYASPADVPVIELTSGVIAVHSETAEVVRAQLERFGLRVQWKSVESVRTFRVTGEYQIMMDGLSMTWPDPDYLRAYFHSAGTGHATGSTMHNPELDALLERGVSITNEAERQEIYRQAEEIILDEAPWIFLYWRSNAYAVDDALQGFVLITGGLGTESMGRYEYFWLD